jgi:EmrB/QacA subfamily drug resistance transporter
MPPRPPRSQGLSRGRIQAVILILAFSGILSALMQTLVVPLIAQLPQLLNTTPSGASWVVTATLLAAAITTPISGRLGDMYGKRRILVFCVLVLILGSVVCAVSFSLAPMVIGRALQGAATSVIPLGISILRDELPPQRLGSAIALISATLGVGASLGLPLSALVSQNFDWHVLFWGTAGIGIVALLLIVLVVPESSVTAPGRFDLVGALGLAAGLVSLLLALTEGATWGWGSVPTVSLFAAAAALLIAWVWFEARVEEPMVDIRVTASRPVLLTNIASLLTGFAMYAMSLTLPQLLQLPTATGYGLGQSMLVAGLCLTPGGLLMMIVSPFAARMSARFGPKITLMLGVLIIAGGYSTGLFLMSEAWQIIIVGAIVGVGIGFAFSSMPALIMASVPIHETGSANGVNALMRSVGTSLAGAVMAVVLTSMVMKLGPVTLPTRSAFQWTFVIGATAALLAFLVAAFIPTRTPNAPAPGSNNVSRRDLIESASSR